MDEIAKYNIERWRALVDANALFTRPALNLDPISAHERLDPEGRLGNLAGKDVLCLACYARVRCEAADNHPIYL